MVKLNYIDYLCIMKHCEFILILSSLYFPDMFRSALSIVELTFVSFLCSDNFFARVGLYVRTENGWRQF